eukprot:Rmarinus@m.16343
MSENITDHRQRSESGNIRPIEHYEALLKSLKSKLALYPYHLSAKCVRELRCTPFQYYIEMLKDTLERDRPYDTIPNFTAADILRLLGLGRNQYISLLSQTRGKTSIFDKLATGLSRGRASLAGLALGVAGGSGNSAPASGLSAAIENVCGGRPEVNIAHWWIVRLAAITIDDLKRCASFHERETLLSLFDRDGTALAGELDFSALQHLCRTGMLYFEVPIVAGDMVSIPPLEGFVMNRTPEDSLEKLLYDVFLSCDEHSTVGQLAEVLQTDVNRVRNAVSLCCRLGFAMKKNVIPCRAGGEIKWHPSWLARLGATSAPNSVPRSISPVHAHGAASSSSHSAVTPASPHPAASPVYEVSNASMGVLVDVEEEVSQRGPQGKRWGFLFDSSIAAVLMMGNLSPGLKTHAVTMFEAGKVPDELLDGLLRELDEVGDASGHEGEVLRFFEQARAFRATLRFLRGHINANESSGSTQCPGALSGSEDQVPVKGLDLLRYESLGLLEPLSRERLLEGKYEALISMAPSAPPFEFPPSCPPFFGPPVPAADSPWGQLFLYHDVGCGPVTLVIPRGTRLRRIPPMLRGASAIRVFSWEEGNGSGGNFGGAGEPLVVPPSGLLKTTNEILPYSPAVLQVCPGNAPTTDVPLPGTNLQGFEEDVAKAARTICQSLEHSWGLGYAIGFLRLVYLPVEYRIPFSHSSTTSGETGHSEATSGWMPLKMHFGVPLFDEKLNSSVCESVSARGLSCADGLAKHHQAHVALGSRFRSFLAKCQRPVLDSEMENLSTVPLQTTESASHINTLRNVDSELCSVQHPEDSTFCCHYLSSEPVPLPRRCVLFDGSQLHFDAECVL